MDLSIIIVNYNTNQYTIDCIASIISQTKSLKYEIIVIDNCSTKENPEEIKERFPQINLIKNDKNLGFGRANNIGIAQSKSTYILLLNSDTIILNKALDKCFRFMQSNFARKNNIGLMGCTLLNEDGTYQNSTFGKSSLWGMFVNSNPILNKLIRNKNRKFDFDRGQFVEGVSGAFMWFRKEVFTKVKPFDPDIFMYSEETELCRNRVSKYYKIYYWPEAKIIHFGGKSGPSKEMYYQNMLSYALTWYKKGILYYLSYLAISFINWLIHLFLIPFTIANKNSYNNYKKVILGYSYIFIDLLFNIPRYKSNWGGRPSPLKLK